MTPCKRLGLLMFLVSVTAITVQWYGEVRTVFTVRQAPGGELTPSGVPGNLTRIIAMLKAMRKGSEKNPSNADLESGIRFLDQLKGDFETLKKVMIFQEEIIPEKEPGISENPRKDSGYLVASGEWDLESPDWQLKFYPGARYTGEVCTERLNRIDNKYPNWAYFTLLESCAKNSPDMMAEVVTVLLNVVSYSDRHLLDVAGLIQGLYAVYPKVKTIMAVPDGFILKMNHNVKIVSISKETPHGEIWNSMLSGVKTPYVLIGRDLIHFDDDCLLERLIREIPAMNLPILGGSIKTPFDGHWVNGCHQMAFRNYTLVRKSGYRHSAHDCLYCNSILGPFVANTSFLKNFTFRQALPENLLFHDLFFRMLKKHLKIAVCPDVMFLVRNDPVTPLTRKQWLPMAVKNGLNKIVIDGNTFTFTCKETQVDQSVTKGLGIAPCSLQKLVDLIKFFMKTCREHNILCATNAGTSVGALKLHTVLPWERDADVSYYSKNFSALNQLGPVFERNGYKLIKEKMRLFNANVFHITGSGWKFDLYPFPELFTEKLRYPGEKMTRIPFDGDWIETPRNVARQIRGRYGPEVYKHVQHYSVLSGGQHTHKKGYKSAGHFSPCPKPGEHNCLDQFEADGNLHFSDPVP